MWQADLDPTAGHEQTGTRPVIIASADPFNEIAPRLVIVVPVTRKYRHPFNVLLEPQEGKLRYRSFAICEMIRAIAVERLQYRLGHATPHEMEEIGDRLRVLLGLP